MAGRRPTASAHRISIRTWKKLRRKRTEQDSRRDSSRTPARAPAVQSFDLRAGERTSMTSGLRLDSSVRAGPCHAKSPGVLRQPMNIAVVDSVPLSRDGVVVGAVGVSGRLWRAGPLGRGGRRRGVRGARLRERTAWPRVHGFPSSGCRALDASRALGEFASSRRADAEGRRDARRAPAGWRCARHPIARSRHASFRGSSPLAASPRAAPARAASRGASPHRGTCPCRRTLRTRAHPPTEVDEVGLVARSSDGHLKLGRAEAEPDEL